MLEFERYNRIFGENFDIEKIRSSEFLWSVRVNTLKISFEDLVKKLEGKDYEIENIPFCKEGLWIKSKENLSKTIEHTLGYFIIQNASSMIPPLVLDPKPEDRILDLCASPGAKTTQIAAMMKNEGLIVANDVTDKRLKALRGNLQRCGVFNTIVTRMYGENFWKTNLKFNKILLDVPCTATGTLNPRILKETSLPSIKVLSKLQKRLLASASKCLEDKGLIVYSTCSLEPEENEENIDFAIRELGLKTDKIGIKDLPFSPALKEWNNLEYDKSVSNAIRIKPDNKMEGFFICKLTK
jgi:NOL1/NOP2/sun family putative RNA methylase